MKQISGTVMKQINTNMVKRFDKYRQNLTYDERYVYSYGTTVAEIRKDILFVLGYWSRTTAKHVNYAAEQLKLKVV
jgi:hypothetical protein